MVTGSPLLRVRAMWAFVVKSLLETLRGGNCGKDHEPLKVIHYSKDQLTTLVSKYKCGCLHQKKSFTRKHTSEVASAERTLPLGHGGGQVRN